MDVSNAITLKKIENKGSQMGHTKKIFKKVCTAVNEFTDLGYLEDIGME
jgi:hypothetical protein